MKCKPTVLDGIVIDVLTLHYIYSVVAQENMFEEIVNDDDDGHQVIAIAHMAYS